MLNVVNKNPFIDFYLLSKGEDQLDNLSASSLDCFTGGLNWDIKINQRSLSMGGLSNISYFSMILHLLEALKIFIEEDFDSLQDRCIQIIPLTDGMQELLFLKDFKKTGLLSLVYLIHNPGLAHDKNFLQNNVSKPFQGFGNIQQAIDKSNEHFHKYSLESCISMPPEFFVKEFVECFNTQCKPDVNQDSLLWKSSYFQDTLKIVEDLSRWYESNES